MSAAREAGRAIMDVFRSEEGHRLKDDRSPVTIADERAEAIVCAALEKAFPGLPIVAEEKAARGEGPNDPGSAFFLVDPLDGTREFIHRRREFTVNIALVLDGRPHCGLIYAPALSEIYFGGPNGAVAATLAPEIDTDPLWRPIRVRAKPQEPVALVSRSHRTPETDAYLDKHRLSEWRTIGSSLKFCAIAKGDADIYPRFGRTMEWDTAAGHAILEAAGGSVVRADGAPLVYGSCRRGADIAFANPDFIARGG